MNSLALRDHDLENYRRIAVKRRFFPMRVTGYGLSRLAPAMPHGTSGNWSGTHQNCPAGV